MDGHSATQSNKTALQTSKVHENGLNGFFVISVLQTLPDCLVPRADPSIRRLERDLHNVDFPELMRDITIPYGSGILGRILAERTAGGPEYPLIGAITAYARGDRQIALQELKAAEMVLRDFVTRSRHNVPYSSIIGDPYLEAAEETISKLRQALGASGQ